MKILFLSHRIPYPPDKGDRIRSYNIIKLLARNHSVALMAVARERVHPKSYEVLAQYCESVDIVPINSNLSTLRAGLGLFTNRPLTLPAFYSRRFHKAVQNKLRNEAFDLIYIYSSSMAQYVLDAQSKGLGERVLGVGGKRRCTTEAQSTQSRKGWRDEGVGCRRYYPLNPTPSLSARDPLHVTPCTLPLIMDFIDVDSQKWFDYAARARQPMKWLYAREGHRLREFERKVATQCDLNVFTTESELKIFRQFAPKIRALVLPNGVEATREPNPSYRPNKLVFVGSMDYWPNIDAMLYFTGAVLPLIQKEIPDTELFIVGRNPSSQVRAMGRLKNVTVTGEVEVTGTYLRDAAASVIPLRIARGIQNKILEAMAHGVPVITTSAALDGITAEPGRNVLTADDPHDFAQKTVAVLKDTNLRQRLSANARKMVQQNYRWETKLQKLEEATASISRNSNLRDLCVLRGESSELRELRDLRGEQLPFVSFIIPAKNEAQMIGRCLDAINNLGYDPARRECIVVDNGSMDDTVKIAKLKGAKVLTMPAGTISALRNYGAREAKGDCLAFIDADCLIDKDWLEKALPHFQNPAVGCVGSHPDIPEDCSWVEKTWHRQTGSKSTIVEVDWLGSANILVRRLAFIEIGGFNEALATCEDVDFGYRLKRQYKILCDREVKSTHFGEVKTVRAFFRKERWRGQSNIQGLVSHGLYLQELPSLLLPLYYLLATTLIPVTLVQMRNGSYLLFLFNVGAILLPSFLLSLRTSLRTSDFTCFSQLIFLYLVYSFARMAALLPVKESTSEKNNFLEKTSL